MTFDVKDSGQRQQFETGAVRDTAVGKSRPDLVSQHFLNRLGAHLAKGALKYTDNNWKKGMPLSRFWASAWRHMVAVGMGKTDEDHLSAVAFNIMAIVHFQELNRHDLDDMGWIAKQDGEVGDAKNNGA